MTDSGHVKFGFFITRHHNQYFDDVCNLAFSVCDITINALSCVLHIHFILHALLFVSDFEQLKAEGFFLILTASMFLSSWGSIHHGYDQLSDKSRE